MMKTSLRIIRNILVCTLLVVGFYSCGTNQMIVEYDDVYGSVPSRGQERTMNVKVKEGTVTQANAALGDYSYQNTASTSTRAEDTASYVAAEFDYDNYYDYEYSSRIRRFQQEEYISDNYYNDYYTNMYWYDYNPYYYGTSIYLGYNWWYPSYSYYRPGWYPGFYGDPFFYYPSPYVWGNSYWDGYWNGYRNGYWDAQWDYCYNPYDRNTFHHSEFRRGYGGGMSNTQAVTTHRSSVESMESMGGVGQAGGGENFRSPSSSAPLIQNKPTFAQRYEMSVAQEPTPAKKEPRLQINEGLRDLHVSEKSIGRNNASVDDMVEKRLEKRIQTPVSGLGVRTYSSSSPLSTPSEIKQPGSRQEKPSGVMQDRGNRYSSSQPNTYTPPSYGGHRSGSSYSSPQYNRQRVETGNTNYQRQSPSMPVRSSFDNTTRTSVRPASSGSSSSSTTTRSTSTNSGGGSQIRRR